MLTLVLSARHSDLTPLSVMQCSPHHKGSCHLSLFMFCVMSCVFSTRGEAARPDSAYEFWPFRIAEWNFPPQSFQYRSPSEKRIFAFAFLSFLFLFFFLFF